MIITEIGFVICLSLVVIIGYVGQVSLINLALAGAAAFTLNRLTVQAHVPFPLPAMQNGVGA